MVNLILFMPQRVDECKFRILKEKLTERGIFFPTKKNSSTQDKTELQKTIAEILQPMSMSQAYNYLLALEHENHAGKK